MLSSFAPLITFLARTSVGTPFSNMACDASWSTSIGRTTDLANAGAGRSR